MTILSFGTKTDSKKLLPFSFAKDHMTFIHLLSQKRKVEGSFFLRCRWTKFGQTVRMAKKQRVFVWEYLQLSTGDGKVSQCDKGIHLKKLSSTCSEEINNHVKLPSEKLMAGT